MFWVAYEIICIFFLDRSAYGCPASSLGLRAGQSVFWEKEWQSLLRELLLLPWRDAPETAVFPIHLQPQGEKISTFEIVA